MESFSTYTLAPYPTSPCVLLEKPLLPLSSSMHFTPYIPISQTRALIMLGSHHVTR
ncbi:hypothetical protein BDV98DRAFT_557591 [Pterulicium gracile]|uniref:Uncharacterized protein n=1 Tax=Pterulicium gracile TaxID=1884261 RepID=A0A5C3R2Y7_9AGAR|nr:hypothetical protein BDV98DRAFT_557591 [Pterula gracilis]